MELLKIYIISVKWSRVFPKLLRNFSFFSQVCFHVLIPNWIICFEYILAGLPFTTRMACKKYQNRFSNFGQWCLSSIVFNPLLQGTAASYMLECERIGSLPAPIEEIPKYIQQFGLNPRQYNLIFMWQTGIFSTKVKNSIQSPKSYEMREKIYLLTYLICHIIICEHNSYLKLESLKA